jgi:RimJ/RimL family protein N-acetyltransferase
MQDLCHSCLGDLAIIGHGQAISQETVRMTRNLDNSGQPISFALDTWKPPQRPPCDPLVGHFCRVELLDPKRHAVHLYQANALDTEGRMWTYLPYGPFETLDNFVGWMNDYCRSRDPLFLALIDNTTDEAVGVASYLRITPASGSIEVGHINYSPLLQRTPAATETMYLMMKRAFELGYRRYEWKCDALNAKSRAAAQRLGLSFEGVFRQATVYKGRNRDTAWYAAIDQEWPALEDAFLRWLDPTNFDERGKQRIPLANLTAPILKQRG